VRRVLSHRERMHLIEAIRWALGRHANARPSRPEPRQAEVFGHGMI
jgi:hypothetical protein